MPGIDVNPLQVVSEIKPSGQADGNAPVANARGGRYRELFVRSLTPTKHELASEGSYFVANNAQTGQISAATTPAAFVATTPWIIIYNNAPAANALSPRIYVDYCLLGV